MSDRPKPDPAARPPMAGSGSSAHVGTVLLIGYGNPGRLDDGLGPALAAAIEALALPGVSVEADYQLVVEHAELAARHEVVIFADAAVAGPEPFAFAPLEPAPPGLEFSSHSLAPAAVLSLARDLFGARPAGYTLAVRGYAFDAFGERLTPAARRNLAAAVEYLQAKLRRGFPRLGKSAAISFQGLENQSSAEPRGP